MYCFYSCEQRGHSDRDGSDPPSVTSICRRIRLVFLQRNEPIGRAESLTITFLSARGVGYINRHSHIYSSWIRSDFIWYIHWIKTQMPFHRKLRAVVLIYKLMAQILYCTAYTTGAFSVTFHRSIQKQLQCCKTICLTQLRTACWASKD